MLRKSIYGLFLLLLLGAVGCTKSHVVEPQSFIEKIDKGNQVITNDDDVLISDDEDDEGDSERDHTQQD